MDTCEKTPVFILRVNWSYIGILKLLEHFEIIISREPMRYILCVKPVSISLHWHQINWAIEKELCIVSSLTKESFQIFAFPENKFTVSDNFSLRILRGGKVIYSFEFSLLFVIINEINLFAFVYWLKLWSFVYLARCSVLIFHDFCETCVKQFALTSDKLGKWEASIYWSFISL